MSMRIELVGIALVTGYFMAIIPTEIVTNLLVMYVEGLVG